MIAAGSELAPTEQAENRLAQYLGEESFSAG